MNILRAIILIITAILVFSLFTLLGLHFVNDLFNIWPVWMPRNTGDKYEIYRDILVLLLAGIGVVGYFIYKETRRHLTEDLMKTQKQILEDLRSSLTKDQYRFLGLLYSHLSHIHWREYEILPCSEPRFKELLELAIEESELTVNYFEKLDDRKYDAHTRLFKINLAYHLAVRQNEEDKKEALRLVRGDVEAIKIYPTEIYNFLECKVWVILRCSDDEKEKKEATKDMKSIMKQSNVPREWKEKMQNKYKKYFSISLTIPT